MPEYAAEESKQNKIIILGAVAVFLVAAYIGITSAFPEPPMLPLTVSYQGEQLFPKP